MTCAAGLLVTECTSGLGDVQRSEGGGVEALPGQDGDVPESLRLTLPPVIYAVPGVPISIYYDNVVLTRTPEAFTFSVDCDIGISEPRRWTLTAGASDVGERPLSISVTDAAGAPRGLARTTLRVVDQNAGASASLSLFIVGDSLTEETFYVNEVAERLSVAGNPRWEMLGTMHPPHSAPGVAHEGRSGWTWARYVDHHDPAPGAPIPSSPFLFEEGDGTVALDFARYFDESSHGARPTVGFFLLGINDCINADPDQPATVEAAIDAMTRKAEKLLAALQRAVPGVDIGVGLVPAPNAREEAFQANYGSSITRWGWKRIQHRLMERQLEHFGGREAAHVFIVPMELGVDPVEGYPADNAVHPNLSGYRQLGSSVYSWLKSRLQGG
jgi:hypothetical protein